MGKHLFKGDKIQWNITWFDKFFNLNEWKLEMKTGDFFYCERIFQDYQLRAESVDFKIFVFYE